MNIDTDTITITTRSVGDSESWSGQERRDQHQQVRDHERHRGDDAAVLEQARRATPRTVLVRRREVGPTSSAQGSQAKLRMKNSDAIIIVITVTINEERARQRRPMAAMQAPAMRFAVGVWLKSYSSSQPASRIASRGSSFARPRAVLENPGQHVGACPGDGPPQLRPRTVLRSAPGGVVVACR